MSLKMKKVNYLKKNKPTVFERKNHNDGDSPRNGALRYELLLADVAKRIRNLIVLIHIREFEKVLMAVGWRISEIIKGELKWNAKVLH